MQGKVKWFNNAKGYGFTTDEEGRDIFIHFSSIIGDGYKALNENDIINFDIIETEKGLQAKNVSLIEEKVGIEDTYLSSTH